MTTSSASQSSSEAYDVRNLHILIVDDDAMTLDLIAGLLQSMGVSKITRAKSGAEAFVILSTPGRVVDCVLCDFSMANGNGLQLLQAVRLGQAKFLRPDACFVLLTASGAPETVSIAAQLDVSGYLRKPATPDKIRTAIAKARGRAIRLNHSKYAQMVIPDA